MIQVESKLEVADNSGAKKIRCIKVLGGSKRRYAGLGDIIVCSVVECMPNTKVKKGDVIRLGSITPSILGFLVHYAIAGFP